MKAYILKDEDFQKLIDRFEKDFKKNRAMTQEEERIYDDAYRFFNYHFRNWMAEVQK
jgi:hypothetical protein